MRTILPAFLIHSILVLSADVHPKDACRQETHATTSNEVITTPLTLWDLGFSLKERWADLREQEECPVPPNLICVDGDSECGDQNVLDTVASALHPSETVSAQQHAPAETEPVTDELEEDLVSFEDWKRKKLEQEEDDDEKSSTSDITTQQSAETEAGSTIHCSSSLAGAEGCPTTLPDVQKSPEPQASTKGESNVPVEKPAGEAVESPKAHVHAHNKYNYASPDCSARIHSSSPSTQHASSLLHKSRDRYMLTPCKADQHWVVVELCDEIRIEAIEIAVWEFFSGVIRDVRVSVGGAEDDDDDEDGGEESANPEEIKRNKWEEVGSFVGKNVRGVQTFTLSHPTSFHRFIRLDFPSFYGTEYYCPVSQVKVYGMNQMEAFKWEQKRQAASAKDRDREKSTKDRDAEERRMREKAEADDRLREQIRREDEKRERELDELEKLVVQQANLAGRTPELTSLPKDLPTIEIVTVTASSTAFVSASAPSASSGRSNVGPRDNGSNETIHASNETVQRNSVMAHANSSSTTSITSMTISSSSSSGKPPIPRSDSSESIYAHIIRRLNALEGNSSLVARYIEEQAKVMRLMLGRVERGWEDWRVEREVDELSRWEQERMRQEDRLGAVISQMEQQRMAIDSERRAVLAEIRLLSEELGHERRRGIAQLVIILTILAIGAATRSSAIDAVLRPLMVEARRRRSVYKSFSGPLAGLAIDMGSDRPPAVIGEPRPDDSARVDAASPPPYTNGKSSHSVKRSDSGRRPMTPRKRHPTGISIPQTRVVSDGAALQNSTSSPFLFGLKSPKARGSLPPPRHGHAGSRKLARSAHLHTMEADRVRRDVKASVDGDSTPRRPQSTQFSPRTIDDASRLISPPIVNEAVFTDSPEVPTDIEQRSDWDTDAEGAISDIDADLRVGDEEVVQELVGIWAGGADQSSIPSWKDAKS